MNINRVCFAGNLTAEPEVNYSPKDSEVVSASLYSNAFYGYIGFGIGRISYANSASLQVSIMGIMTAITTTAIVITTKVNFVRAAKSSEDCPVLPEERIIKTSIPGDL